MVSEAMKTEMNICHLPVTYNTLAQKFTEAMIHHPLEQLMETIFRQDFSYNFRNTQSVRVGSVTLSGTPSELKKFIYWRVLDTASVGVSQSHH